MSVIHFLVTNCEIFFREFFITLFSLPPFHNQLHVWLLIGVRIHNLLSLVVKTTISMLRSSLHQVLHEPSKLSS